MALPQDKSKYINALLYFIKGCDNEKLGVMKLHKLLYYLDFISYRDRKKTVTGEVYLHLPKGPFASSLQDEIIPIAKKNKVMDHKEDSSEKYGKRNRFRALVEPDMTLFDDYEKELLAYLCKKFKSWKTEQMVAQTHVEAPWVFSEPSKRLRYKDADDISFFESAERC
ncbi:TPA: hypothetical protein DEP58_04830 [Patescibacteria group bacterium]|nr:MAG: hypothetical protein UU98_C0014G0014 [Parcubacteria group bacterium GW2011_GWD2_42_14]HCC05590.1 hypothetical protein [Patescibacteria group bacterium]